MTNAILMASGLGTRMRPVTEKIPKPLVKVGGKPMIETVIDGFEKQKVDRIIVIVGYLKEQFDYLKTKYPNVELVENNSYQTINNISSIYAAREWLKKGNCFICEADLYLADDSILERKLETSCYFGKMVEGYSGDWVFETDINGIITRIGKQGTDCFNMVGISYFDEKDALTLYDAIALEYYKPGYEELFWDEVVNKHIDDFSLKIEPVLKGQIYEIDTVDELNELNIILKKG